MKVAASPLPAESFVVCWTIDNTGSIIKIKNILIDKERIRTFLFEALVGG